MKNSAITHESNKPKCAYDKKRMELVLSSELITTPKGMSREQMKAFIKSKS